MQDALLRRKVEPGETVVGVKPGLTSRVKQQRTGMDTPLTAWLTDAMVLPAGEPLPMAELIHPSVDLGAAAPPPPRAPGSRRAT